MIDELDKVMQELALNGNDHSESDAARLVALNISQKLEALPSTIMNSHSEDILLLFDEFK